MICLEEIKVYLHCQMSLISIATFLFLVRCFLVKCFKKYQFQQNELPEQASCQHQLRPRNEK